MYAGRKSSERDKKTCFFILFITKMLTVKIVLYKLIPQSNPLLNIITNDSCRKFNLYAVQILESVQILQGFES